MMVLQANNILHVDHNMLNCQYDKQQNHFQQEIGEQQTDLSESKVPCDTA
jgi:hypothetical protein